MKGHQIQAWSVLLAKICFEIEVGLSRDEVVLEDKTWKQNSKFMK